MIIWLVLAGITAAVVAAVVSPLRRREAGGGGVDSVAFYKAQLGEVKNDLARGLVSQDDAKALTTEISRRLLKAAASEEARRKEPPKPELDTGRIAVIAAVAIVAVTFGVYAIVGSPSLPGEPLTARLDAPLTRNSPMDAMVAKVEAKLRANPADAAGWNAIAPVYLRVHRFADAADAFGKAMSLSGETPELLAGYGEALTMLNNGTVNAPAREAFEKALKLQPDMPAALFWLASAKEEEGQLAEAREGYQTLLKNLPHDETRTFVEQRLAQVEARLKGEPVNAGAKPELTGDQQAMVNDMVSKLAERLEKNGGSLGEWLRLIRSYGVLGKTEQAAAAANKARAQFSSDPVAIAKIGEMLKAGPAQADAKPEPAATAAKPEPAGQKLDSVDQMAGKLAERLEKNGGSLDEWLLLIRSYGVQGKKELAAAAADKARAQFSSDPAAAGKIGELLASFGLKS